MSNQVNLSAKLAALQTIGEVFAELAAQLSSDEFLSLCLDVLSTMQRYTEPGTLGPSREATVGMLAAAMRHMGDKLPAQEWDGLCSDVMNTVRIYDSSAFQVERAPEGPL